MTKEEINELVGDWISESEDTNEYCTRTLITEALIFLERDPPEVKSAIRRLREVVPLGHSRLINPPEFIKEYENNNS